jgi:nicotinate phosphoribosyltransferase
MEENDRDIRDVIARAHEDLTGRPLLSPVMRGGERLAAGYVDLESARVYGQQQIDRLPDPVRAITPARPFYPVEVSRELSRFQKKIKDELALG